MWYVFKQQLMICLTRDKAELFLFSFFPHFTLKRLYERDKSLMAFFFSLTMSLFCSKQKHWNYSGSSCCPSQTTVKRNNDAIQKRLLLKYTASTVETLKRLYLKTKESFFYSALLIKFFQLLQWVLLQDSKKTNEVVFRKQHTSLWMHLIQKKNPRVFFLLLFFFLKVFKHQKLIPNSRPMVPMVRPDN